MSKETPAWIQPACDHRLKACGFPGLVKPYQGNLQLEMNACAQSKLENSDDLLRAQLGRLVFNGWNQGRR